MKALMLVILVAGVPLGASAQTSTVRCQEGYGYGKPVVEFSGMYCPSGWHKVD